jgi:pyruvate,orthophosphate dikinase
MMNTILNIGLNDVVVEGLSKLADNPRFAWDSYRRLIEMFGTTVFGLDDETESQQSPSDDMTRRAI